jgi:hypothetical protein
MTSSGISGSAGAGGRVALAAVSIFSQRRTFGQHGRGGHPDE